MSLTVEQRAHDLAILATQLKYDIEKTKLINIAQEESKQGNSISVDISFDVYPVYSSAYKILLEELKNDH